MNARFARLISDCRELTAVEARLLLSLARRADDSGLCHYGERLSISQLACEAHISERQARRVVQNLTDKGFVSVALEQSGTRSRIYRLNREAFASAPSWDVRFASPAKREAIERAIAGEAPLPHERKKPRPAKRPVKGKPERKTAPRKSKRTEANLKDGEDLFAVVEADQRKEIKRAKKAARHAPTSEAKREHEAIVATGKHLHARYPAHRRSGGDHVVSAILPGKIRQSAELHRRSVLEECARVRHAIDVIAASEEWQRQGGRYVPSIAKFVDEARWNDVEPSEKRMAVSRSADPSQVDYRTVFPAAFRGGLYVLNESKRLAAELARNPRPICEQERRKLRQLAHFQPKDFEAAGLTVEQVETLAEDRERHNTPQQIGA